MAAKTLEQLTAELLSIVTGQTNPETITPQTLGSMLQDFLDSFYNNQDTPLNLATVTGNKLTTVLKGTAALTFGDVLTQLFAEQNISVPGAADGDPVILGCLDATVPAACCHYFAYVSAPDVITVRFVNASTGTVTPPTGTFNVTIIK